MQLLTFTLGNAKYGIPVQAVQSIERDIHMIELPKSLPYIRGIIKLHGDIIPVYSLSEKFGYPRQEGGNVIVARAKDLLVAFEVSKVESILEVSGNHIAPMPQMINSMQHYMTDVADYNKSLIVMLDVGELFSEDDIRDLRSVLAEEEEQKQE